MMKHKFYATFFLLIFSAETFYPGVALALTSGPAAPEVQKFTPAGTNDMVDLFTGDLKQNIPLLDVGGYPLNLSYQSGHNMEEEASWVGAGWTLNPGSVNRTLRGLPDDFDGDNIQKQFYKKDFKKAGGQIVVKPSFWGFDNIVNLSAFKLDVYKDNYYGIGASFGASVSFNLGGSKDTKYTAGLDFSSDSRDGVNIRPSFDMTTSREDDGNDVSNTTLSGSLLYNTRAGLKSYSLDASFGVSSGNQGESQATRADVGSTTIGSFTHYFGQTYTPSFSVNSKSSSYTLSVDIGPYLFGGYLGLGGSGYVYNEHVTDANKTVLGYGYLNYLHGRDNDNALLDFNREKDGVFIPSAPSIAVPVATQDLFSATGQTGIGQYRAFTGGDYVVADPKYSNVSDNAGAKLTVGGGWIWQLGGRLDYTHGDAVTKKWSTSDNNNFLNVGQFPANPSNPLDEPAYFKQVGEHSAADGSYLGTIDNANADAVKLNGFSTTTAFKSRNSSNIPLSTLKRNTRDKRIHPFSYLTAAQASNYALEPTIVSHPGSAISDYNYTLQSIGRTASYRRGNHISEVTVTDNEGKRMVYGIPVYNITHQEISYAVNPNAVTDKVTSRRTGLITYTSSDINPISPTGKNGNGRDGLVQKETTPAYATSWLLSGVLSPDYVDRTGDGISDDDYGTAYKFNYNNIPTTYKWRAPYQLNMANWNEQLQSDPKDDRGTIVYGEKELWYLRSVESKTEIAIFSTSNREDGLGVNDQNGGINSTARVLKLDSISLYTKADWNKNGPAATPIKVVHFEYDYSICPGVPNNTGTQIANPYNPANPSPNLKKGKLTLRKVYFTFGNSARAQTNPYIFDYNFTVVNPGVAGLPLPNFANDPAQEEANDLYVDRQGDRWGTYKQSWYNNPNPGSGVYLNNSEYPYSLQKNSPPTGVSATDWSDLLDRMAGKWQLSSITSPTGAVITVTYEAKDYAYVQDQEAMQMYFIKGFEDANQNPTGLINSQYIDVVLPVALTGGLSEFTTKYLDGTNTLFYKVNTNLKGDLSAADIANKTFNEYVTGYASIDPTRCIVSADNKTVKLFVVQTGQYSPIAKQAWQKIKTDLPQYAYNGYDNSDLTGGDLAIIGEAIYWTLVNFREIWTSFDVIASKAGMAGVVDLTKSMVRLKSPTVSSTFSDGTRTFSKTGGGCRVRKLEVADQWANMGGTGAKTAHYGQEYKYTTTGKYGTDISSGVASYEPQGGNEENPFHQPIPYTEKVHWGIDKNHFIEKPYCESYFPAPVVGYSKVTVTNYGDNNARETGYAVNEFYTAKDFPTLVDNLPLDAPSSQFLLPLLFFTAATYNQATSQGFKIELNDMHGKPKATHTYDKGGREIASTEYFYRVQDQGAEDKQLNNDGVPILNKDGTIGTATLATDVDLVTDARYSKNENIGGSVGIYPGGFVIPLAFFPLYIPTFGVVPYVTYMNKSYYSTSTVKAISRYGILTKTRNTRNGSSITAEITLWDPETGDPLVTRTQNEFNDYTYNFRYPAYMSYDGMGGAYKDLGAIFTGFTTSSTGQITSPSSPSLYLFPGDELINTTASGLKGWVMISSDNSYRLIDKDGNFIANASGTWAVVRSGRRNLLSQDAGTIVCAQNPVQGTVLSLDVSRQILDAKAVVYHEQWSMPQYCGNDSVRTAPTGSAGCVGVCEGDQSTSYNQCGTQIFAPGFDMNTGLGSVIYSMSGTFWGGNCGAPVAAAAALSVGAKSALASTSSTKTINDSLASFSTMSGVRSLAVVTPNVSFPSGCTQLPGTRAPVDQYPLSRTSIWTCMGNTGGRQPLNTPVRFATTITVPATKTYYVGISADNEGSFYLDGQLIVHLVNSGGTVFNYWEVYPVNITQGTHTIIMQGVNYSGPAAMGCEIYNNTAAEINAATSYSNLNMVYTTRDAVGQNLGIGTLTCSSGYLDMSTGSPSCLLVTAPPITLNPYSNDELGNWHQDTTYVYTVSRSQTAGLAGQNGGTNIRQNGYYNSFIPFWQFQPSGSATYTNALSDSRWVWNKAPILFDQKGNEIEAVDGLGRFSSALFGYSQSFATAVAANARHNEIAFDGFEDYYFSVGAAGACPAKRQLDWGLVNSGGTVTSPSGSLTNQLAHTGNYSYQLTSTATVTKSIGSGLPLTSFLGYDGTGRYMRTGDEQGPGFAPVNGKKYVISLWVNEDNGGNPVSNLVQKLDVRVNGVSLNPGAAAVPVVEGWKRIELPFTVSGSSFQLDLVPSGTIYIDDIRILPFDGEINTYVYDDVNLRLTGKLDENNFATLYEYDAEGHLIRVKKETERGVMTVNENRQSFLPH